MNIYTIIVCTLGRHQYVRELIETLLGQDIKPKEIILVIEDTNENRIHFSEKYVKAPFTLIFTQNLTLGAMRNIGVQNSTTNNIMFSDDDDLWFSHKSKKILQALENYNCVTHNFNKFGNINKEYVSKLGSKDRLIASKDFIRGTNIFGGGSSICASKKLLQLFPFDEKMRACEDFEWWTRVYFVGIQIAYIGMPLVSYRDHNSNMAKKTFNNLKFTNYFLLKHLNSHLKYLLFFTITMVRSLMVFVKKNIFR